MARLKPDRFQQMVGQSRYIARDGMGYIILESTAVDLLRLYHRRVVQIVKRQPIMKPDYYAEQYLNRSNLLAVLAQLKKCT